MSEIITVTHLVIAGFYASKLFEKYKTDKQYENSQLKAVFEVDSHRDLKSAPECLLPFRRTFSSPQSQLELFCLKLTQIW